METIASPEKDPGSAELWYPDRKRLREEYDEFLPQRTMLARELQRHIEEAMTSLPSIPKINSRVKSFGSFLKKYIRYLNEGSDPARINDIVGIRIVCPYKDDLTLVEEALGEKFNILEVERKGGDLSFKEFGYESIHLIVAIPDDITKARNISCCETAEVQIRTILQDAWAEVEHELIYKAEFTPYGVPLKRKLAAVQASLSLADTIFQEIRSYSRELKGQLGQRRDSFFQKIENSTDALLFGGSARAKSAFANPAFADSSFANLASLPQEAAASETPPSPAFSRRFIFDPAAGSIDELLLEALCLHNGNQLPKAIDIYTRILEMNPGKDVTAIIYKHRAMAYFTCSKYEEAVADFSTSLELDPESYKSAYYKGIICSVLERYPQAVDAFNLSLAIYPYQPYCFYRRGQAYYHLGDYPKALGDCETALSMEPFELARKFKELLLSKLKM